MPIRTRSMSSVPGLPGAPRQVWRSAFAHLIMVLIAALTLSLHGGAEATPLRDVAGELVLAEDCDKSAEPAARRIMTACAIDLAFCPPLPSIPPVSRDRRAPAVVDDAARRNAPGHWERPPAKPALT